MSDEMPIEMPTEIPAEMQTAIQGRQEYKPQDPPSVWKQNHGNLIVGLMLSICCVGAGVLAYRQSRFVAPSFPDGSLIQNDQEPAGRIGDGKGPYLKIAVEGAVSDRGNMVLSIYGDDTKFADITNAIVLDMQPVEFGAAKWEIPLEVLPEKFSILAFHDENNDGFPNRRANMITERFGMSNDARNDSSIGKAMMTKPKKDTLVEIFVR